MQQLPEDEALLIAVVFEETGAYQYKKNKELESSSPGGGGETYKPGLKEGFEEVWVFGDDDDTDYWHFKDTGVDIVD